MSTKVSTAQERTREIIGEILTDEASVWVSRSFVGGTNGGTCNSPVTISTPVQITSVDEVNEIKVTADGGTQLGAAFEAAIQSLGDAPATIYMFTDGNESQQCGRSLCDAYRYINPDREKVELRPISIVEGLDLDDKFACIHSNDEQDWPDNNPSHQDRSQFITISNSNSTPASSWHDLSPLSKSYPIVLLSLIAFLVFRFQKKYSDISQEIEKDIGVIRKNGSEGDTDDTDHAIDRDYLEVRIHIIDWSALIIFGILVALVTFPLCNFLKYSPICSFIGHSQKSVWLAFDSDFATAFSILATAPILYAGSQYVRYRLALQNKMVISGAHSLELKREREEELRRTKERLESLQRAVSSYEFSSPTTKRPIRAIRGKGRRSGSIQSNRSDRDQVDNTLWEDMTRIATSLAAGEVAFDGKDTDTLKQAQKEITRLESYNVRKVVQLHDFIAFYKILENDESVNFERSLWADLVSAIANKSAAQINSALTKIQVSYSQDGRD